MSVASVILAAGASQRLGELKQLICLGQETLLERSVRIGREACCEPVVVVLGASAEIVRERCSLEDAIVVINQEWPEGMGASVRAGVRALDASVEGCVVMTCDMPAVTAQHLRALMVTGEITASSYAGRLGVPAYFPRAKFRDLMKLRGDTGARDLLRTARAMELVGGEIDLDTPEDLARVREIFE